MLRTVYRSIFISLRSCQVFFNGSRFQTTFFSWCVQIALVNISLYSAGSNLYPWLNLCFLASVGTSYEIERHSRILFLNQRDALRLMGENTKLQLEIATKVCFFLLIVTLLITDLVIISLCNSLFLTSPIVVLLV